MEKLNAYAKEHESPSAWLAGLGGAGSATLSFYDFNTKTYVDKTFDSPMEILGLQGNLAWVDGEPVWHVHGVFAGADYNVVGGHVQKLEISLTGEIHITPLETPLTRRYDDVTGLKLLDEDR